MADTTVVMPNPPNSSLKEKLTAGLKAGCPRCGSVTPWGAASWCPDCGFYPGLSPEGAGVSTAEVQTQAAEMADENLNLWQRVPAWVYVLCAGEIVIFGLSLAVRLITDDGSFERSLWSALQLILGVVTFVTMQVVAFAKGVMKENFSPADMIAHPIRIWEPSLRHLPKGTGGSGLRLWGITAAVCAMAIIGGLRYSVLFEDWGFRQRAKQNLMQKIADAARNSAGEGADNLEDAMKDFVGEASKNVPNPNAKKKESPKVRKEIECAIIGYQVNPASNDGEIQTLLLAAVHGRGITFAGTVKASTIPENFRANVLKRLPTLHRERPFVKCKLAAQWVQPVLACKVKYEDWPENKELVNTTYEEQLADLPVPGKKK